MDDFGESRYWIPNNGASTLWTKERTEQFKALFLAGLTFSQIAIELGDGLTRNACIGKAHRLGLDREKPLAKPKRIRIPRDTFKQKVATVAILFYPEMSNIALAALLQVSETTVRLARLHLKFPPPPPEPGRIYKRRIAPRKADAPETTDSAISLLDLQWTSCRWPVGEATGAEQLFCGQLQADMCSYCEAHACKAYRPVSRLREAA